jgi:hypothetical protein
VNAIVLGPSNNGGAVDAMLQDPQAVGGGLLISVPRRRAGRLDFALQSLVPSINETSE